MMLMGTFISDVNKHKMICSIYFKAFDAVGAYTIKIFIQWNYKNYIKTYPSPFYSLRHNNFICFGLIQFLWRNMLLMEFLCYYVGKLVVTILKTSNSGNIIISFTRCDLMWMHATTIFLMWCCETVHTVGMCFMSFVWITHCNHTEWVWNLFICDIGHILSQSHHKNNIIDIHITYFFYFSRIHKNAPCERGLKAHSHGAMRDCDLLYQEMECCLRFSDFVHKVQRVWMRFPMYLHWNRTSQSHRMGVEPNRVPHHIHQCITRTWNCTMWTPSLTSTQSIFCITVANKKIAPCERALRE